MRNKKAAALATCLVALVSSEQTISAVYMSRRRLQVCLVKFVYYLENIHLYYLLIEEN